MDFPKQPNATRSVHDCFNGLDHQRPPSALYRTACIGVMPVVRVVEDQMRGKDAFLHWIDFANAHILHYRRNGNTRSHLMKTISLKLPEKVLRQLEHTARERGQTKSDVVRAALEQFLNGERPPGRPLSALELAGDLVGSAEGPSDLSTHAKHFEGYGK
jgi:Arc/MetJ-type ribon-helix-helix transcriptional regulator